MKSIVFWQSLLRSAAGLLLYFLCSSLTAAPPSLEEIRDEYQASLDRIGTVWFQFKQVRTSHIETVESYEATCEYAVDGPRELIVRTCLQLPDRTAYINPVVYGCDGRTTWSQSFESLEATTPMLVWLRPRDEDDGKSMRRDFPEWVHWSILGLHMNFEGHSIGAETLPSLMRKAVNPEIAEETLDEQRVWRVNIGPLQNEMDPCEVTVTAWFDPAAGFLPKQIVVDSGTFTSTTMRHVETFATSEDGVWFPTVWTETHISPRGDVEHVTQTRVSEWKVNAAVEKTIFAARTPPGIRVIRGQDRRQIAQQLQSIMRDVRNVGPVARAGASTGPVRASMLANVPQQGDSLNASPPRTRVWLWLLAFGLALLAGLGVWKVRQPDPSSVG